MAALSFQANTTEAREHLSRETQLHTVFGKRASQYYGRKDGRWNTRKAQRTKERHDYERERATITEQLSYQAHTDEQLTDIYARCDRYRDRLHTATKEQQRELLVLFEVKARLAIEDGLKVAHVTCKLGNERIVIDKLRGLRLRQDGRGAGGVTGFPFGPRSLTLR
jgi:ATPase subunit of ABC transporter with duplicated ATPase domains